MKEVKKVLKSMFKQYPRACLVAMDFLAEEWKNRIIAESKACHKLIGKVSKEDGGVNRGRFFPLMQTLQGIQMMAYSTNNPNVEVGPYVFDIIDKEGNYVNSTVHVTCFNTTSIYLFRVEPFAVALDSNDDD